jgi:hypothetical protein
MATPRNPAKAETLMRPSIHCMAHQGAARAFVPEWLDCHIHVSVNRVDVRGICGPTD